MNEPGAGVSLPDSEWSRPVLLQQAREQAGLHIAALAAALKVPVRKLEALEAGRYDELPDLTFARALASSACRQLRMDPAPVLAQIPQGKRPVLGVVSEEALNTPFRPAREGAAASAQAGPARLWSGAAGCTGHVFLAARRSNAFCTDHAFGTRCTGGSGSGRGWCGGPAWGCRGRTSASTCPAIAGA
ncbi:MAG: helix-turn-helix domain-containing protein [Hydrogenophaga sp.]|nr:helix-turn-helix domain-containing protein [Hydrogenophaga sp.]